MTHIVYASDDRGFLPLAVATGSLLEHAGAATTYCVWILDNGLTAEHREVLRAQCVGSRHEVRFVPIAHRLASYPILAKMTRKSLWTVTTWARLFIPEVLPPEAHRALYLDTDTYVCQDLEELFATPMGSAAIAAVRETMRPSGKNGCHAGPHGYFQAGVLLFNLDAFRSERLFEKIVQYFVRHADTLLCLDQDAVNGALGDRILPLRPEWNWHDGATKQLLIHFGPEYRAKPMKDCLKAALHPGILHFQGSHKPWCYNIRPEGPRYEATMRRLGLVTGLLPGATVKLRFRHFFAFTFHYPVMRFMLALRLQLS